MTERTAIVAEARRWLRTPYMHQGRLHGVGVDCAGLIIVVARALEIVAPDFDVQGYPRVPDGESLCGYCGQFMARLPVAEAGLGDVVVMHHPRTRGRTAAHMGILGDYPYGGYSLIHALGDIAGKGSVVEHRLDAPTRGRVVAAYRMPGVA